MQAVSFPESGVSLRETAARLLMNATLSLIHYKKPLGNPMTEQSDFPGIPALTEHVERTAAPKRVRLCV